MPEAPVGGHGGGGRGGRGDGVEGRPDGLSEVHVQLLTPVNFSFSSLGKDPKVNYCKVNYTPLERALFVVLVAVQ